MAGHIADSGNVHWGTPETIRDATHETFGGPPDLDPASNPHSIIGAKREWQLPEHDGLTEDWAATTVFNNPPFGSTIWKISTGLLYTPKDFKKLAVPKHELALYRKTTIADWVTKLDLHGNKMGAAIGLIPAAVGTKHWQLHVFGKAAAICWHEGRVSFKIPPTPCDSAGCPYMAVYACPDPDVEEAQIRFCPGHKKEHPGRKWHTIEGPAPMDCAIVLWTTNGQTIARFDNAFGKLGHVTLRP